MASGANGPEKEPRVTREEMFPKVGEATESLKALMPTFGEGLVMQVITTFSQGVTKASLELTGTGKNPQTLKVSIEKPEQGLTLRVAMEGDWEDKPNVPVGLPLIADFKGKIYRRRKPEDADPIAEVGAILNPRDPFALGSRGKNTYWLLRLPPRQFPNGGRITQFMVPSGEDVEKGETILAYIDPL